MHLTLSQIAKIFGIERYDRRIVKGVSFDSRKCKKGDLFFALKGKSVDGHTFLHQAKEKGAIAAVVEENYTSINSSDIVLFPVKSPLKALQNLAKYVIQENRPILIGITGSVGKTTTKEFCLTLLQEDDSVKATPGNQNTQVSLPAMILNCNPLPKTLILEMGASHPGNIDQLLEIAPIDYAILTHISESHTAFFKDIAGVAHEKQKILFSSQLKKAFVSEQAAQWVEKKPLNMITYSYKSSQSFYSLIQTKKGNWQIREGNDFSPLFTLPIHAKHHLENFLAAVALAREFGVSFKTIIQKAKMLQPYEHRFQTIEKDSITWIDDAYNASLASFSAAFESLPQKQGKRIGIIGEMRELGKATKKSHLQLGKEAMKVFDEVFCIGAECQVIVDLFQKHNRLAGLYQNTDQISQHLKKRLSQGDLVFIKGSNSFKLWEIIEKV